MSKYDSYVICTSPRSGSTLLCKLLAATGVSGNPGSYFHRPSISEWLAYFDLPSEAATSERETLATIFRAAIAKGSLNTGMFGLRLQRHSFDFFVQKLAVLHPEPASDLKRFEAAFGRTLFIYLTRLDKIEQAVSIARAEQTGLWHMAPDGTELERLAPSSKAGYNAEEIRTYCDRFTSDDLDWRDWFKSQRIEPLQITYETLSSNPIETLREILGELGLNRDAANGVISGVAKLADETSRDWVARFRAECGFA
ncbi:Stf0 family sulfotransferase [Sinorhizobium garamanticum]|uniref:Stf0 family sulfotransferase n=1 Tax=Sinorhizobium garamanticum TaxID=680247 RepID=A0ABY8D706_9HYPH|nr:Stf0 family sulfotransferase [Sinorhizobium garamanticum]WEX86658.1 Stf0 family sulfotransferase [Sinorhizobium garamanticum]